MTKAQLKPFFRAVNRAASAQGLVGREAVEEYRKRVMQEEVGAEHASDIDPGDGFDRVMYRLAVDGGDWAAAVRHATGEERRMAALVESCARQVIELRSVDESCPFGGDHGGDKRDEAIAYVVGCLRQAGFLVYRSPAGEWWADISAREAFAVFRMLDTHRRRLLRSLGWSGPLSFDIAASWSLDNVLVVVGQVEADSRQPIHVGRVSA